ncbi:hypothetical protein niasHT_036860 [Heterodera trifolii]|uniref:Phytanoyl-CoA hydroxylase-interacting protein-like C-terminal domain-containing protein n=1 Tax=Heterodera trifolii TaxID=157864 RepID=A0ABD2I7Q2_9BILA
MELTETNDKLKLHLTVRLEKLEAGLARVVRGNELGMVMDKVMPIHITHSEFNAFPDNQLASGIVYERAIFSLEEMKVLMQKAIDFTGSEMQPFTYLYRCKPKIYWDYVINETRAEMNPYEKDSNGQAASPINTAISGKSHCSESQFNFVYLFRPFFLRSFGPERTCAHSVAVWRCALFSLLQMLPASTLLQPQLNLYFADFYCNTKPHYVTVVVCREFSDIDRFCRRTCIPLAPFDNPFLLFQPNNSPTVPLTFSAKRNVWVEIYYTDNVPLAWGQLHHISTFGVGTSKIGGLPHNKSCRVCNLYPQGPIGGETVQPLPENVEPIPAEKAEQMVREAAAAELVDERDKEEEDRERREQGKDGAGREGEELHQRRDTTEDGQRQVPFDELQNRLQQIERAVSKDAAALVGAASAAAQCAKGNGSDGSTAPANFVEFVQQISGFLSEMHQDFKDLNSKIDSMESIIWLQRNDEEEALGEPIGGLELIDEAYDDADVDALLRDDNDEEAAQKEAENDDVDKNRTEQRKANKNDVSISVHETVDKLLGRVKKLEEDKQKTRTDKEEKQTLRRTRRRTSTTNATAAAEGDGRKKRCRRESH